MIPFGMQNISIDYKEQKEIENFIEILNNTPSIYVHEEMKEIKPTKGNCHIILPLKFLNLKILVEVYDSNNELIYRSMDIVKPFGHSCNCTLPQKFLLCKAKVRILLPFYS